MEDDNIKSKSVIRRSIVIFISILCITIIALIILKYEVEGETNMPFELSKIMVISSAEGIQKEGSQNKWDLDLIQNNDLYLTISKNKEYNKTEIIDKIVLDNFVINENPQIGDVTIYRPSDNQNKTYILSEDFVVTDKLEYTGNIETDLKNLKIANQGGMIFLRFANKTGKEYVSNEDVEIYHDGTLLASSDITSEQLKFKVSFDITIQLKSEKSYKTNIVLEFPEGNILEEGTSSLEKTKLNDIVFKRN